MGTAWKEAAPSRVQGSAIQLPPRPRNEDGQTSAFRRIRYDGQWIIHEAGANVATTPSPMISLQHGRHVIHARIAWCARHHETHHEIGAFKREILENCDSKPHARE